MILADCPHCKVSLFIEENDYQLGLKVDFFYEICNLELFAMLCIM